VGTGFGAASWFGAAMLNKVKSYVVEEPEREEKPKVETKIETKAMPEEEEE